MPYLSSIYDEVSEKKLCAKNDYKNRIRDKKQLSENIESSPDGPALSCGDPGVQRNAWRQKPD